MHSRSHLILLAGLALASSFAPLLAAPVVSRLTPPSGLFSFGDPNPPIIARFLPGQRFDLQATVQPDGGTTIAKIEFLVDGILVDRAVALTPATFDATPVLVPVPRLPEGSTVGTTRAYSSILPGVHQLSVRATQSNGAIVTATGNFEIVSFGPGNPLTRARNVIVLIGDGMGIAHRTAARIMGMGISQGKALAPLAMDQFPVTGIVSTHSLNSIVTDSAPGSSCYSSGNKNNNNQEGVFPDDTADKFDNPRTEYMGEYLARTAGKSLGIVTTADVFDATPAAWAVHTQDRGAGTGICDQYLDEAVAKSNLTVLLGGGRKWFLPSTTPGSSRVAASDYVLPAELAAGWDVPRGALDPSRDLIAEFQAKGFRYAANSTQLAAIPAGTDRLLGLFTLSNMNVALDKINGRRGNATVVNDYGFPDQPMLDEMTDKALQVLSRNPAGFVLMIEGASIDKQAHNMDTERWILETIEFDRAVERCRRFALANPDTLVVITADHECAGVNIIGATTVTNSNLLQRVAVGGVASVRDGAFGTYESAGFPNYRMLPDGFPQSTDVDRRMLVGYAGNGDRYEDWLTNAQPLRDSQQPFNGVAPLNAYPSGPLQRDVAGGFLVTGQIYSQSLTPATTVQSAVHTASDIPLSALGAGASLFSGTMDNTDVFFRTMQAVLVGTPALTPPPVNGQRSAADRLVNVSNRGFVGTGAQTMISGFVIDGTQPRTLLIRAVGPGLARYGVTGVLADPVLTILNGANSVIFANDNWETNPNVEALRTTSRLVAAPPLDAGSRDAALLVTLPPGTYSAQVSGISGGTGIALIEIYEAP